MNRYLFCPICGERVSVKTDGQMPEVHRLPDHLPLGNANPHVGCPANVCAGSVITVTIDFDKCERCGQKISKHPSGLCMKCFGESTGFARSREPSLEI